MQIWKRARPFLLLTVGVLSRHAGLVVVLLIALAARLIYVHWFKAFPPGDVFNYLTIAAGLPHGEYAPSEKRLPFFPLLILLAHAFLPWEAAGLVISIGASLTALILLYALGRTLGLSKTSLALALLVLQAQPQFLIASTRAYADTTLIALTLAALLAILRARAGPGGVLAGALLGAAALTRYEGGVVAAFLLPLWILFPLHRPRRVPAVAAGAFLLCLLPYLALAFANGRPLLGAGYVAEARASGYGVLGVRSFLNNGLEMWRRAGLVGVWRIPAAVVRDIAADPFGTPRSMSQRLAEPGDGMAILAAVGIGGFLFRKRWRALLFLTATYVATTLPAAWYHPFPRYDIFILPATTLLSAAGLSGLQRLVERGTPGRAGRRVRIAAGAVLLFFVSLWTINLAERTRDMQLKHNGRELAFYQAIQAARKLPGRIAFDEDRDITNLYFKGRVLYIKNLFERGIPKGSVRATLQAEQARYLVLPDRRADWAPFVNEPSVKIVQTFEVTEGDGEINRAAIYDLN